MSSHALAPRLCRAALCGAVALVPALPAQGDYSFQKSLPGTIGQVLLLSWSGAPANKTLVQMWSATAGPTPLSLLSPGDTRSLEVGLDLAALWTATTSGATGSGAWPIPVPNNAGLHGLGLHFQTCTIPGAATVVDKISNRCMAQLGLAGKPAALAASLPNGRALMGTFPNQLLSAGRGDVVVAAGGSGPVLNSIGLRTSDVYSFATMTARPGPMLNIARGVGTTTVLPDGRVLLAGGVDALGVVTKTAEIYDPATHAFTFTGQMSVPRAMHAATLLADGRVLVGGGTAVFTDPVAALANAHSSCEIWSPATGQWSAAADMGARRLAPGLDALPNGKVLMSGGFEIVVLLGLPLPIGAVNACRLYTVATNTWVAGPSMGSARAIHSINNLLLKDGRLLVTGGASSGPDLTAATPIAACELYDPTANAWVPLPAMAQARCGHSVTQLQDGRVFACGGMQGTLNAPQSIALVQVLDPATKTWAPAGANLTTPRAGHGAAVTPDGLIVLFGGNGGAANGTLTTMETIHP